MGKIHYTHAQRFAYIYIINSSHLILKAFGIKIFKRRAYILPSKIFHRSRSFTYITAGLLSYVTRKHVISPFRWPGEGTHTRGKLVELVCLSVRTPTIVLATIAARTNCLHDNFAKTGIKLIRNYWLRSRGTLVNRQCDNSSPPAAKIFRKVWMLFAPTISPWIIQFVQKIQMGKLLSIYRRNKLNSLRAIEPQDRYKI